MLKTIIKIRKNKTNKKKTQGERGQQGQTTTSLLLTVMQNITNAKKELNNNN